MVHSGIAQKDIKINQEALLLLVLAGFMLQQILIMMAEIKTAALE
jgi:predicted aspartyl protease